MVGVQEFAPLFIFLDTMKPLSIFVPFPLPGGIAGASLHTVLRRSELLTPKIISIQIYLLKKKGNKVKLNITNTNFRMVFGGSVNVKLM